nr:odorant binding protein 3 [Apocheima cinerarius]
MNTSTLPVFLILLAFGNCGKDKPVFCDDAKEIIQTVHDACVANTGVSEEDIANCEKGIFKEDTKLKCYMFCLFEEASLADEDGIVDYEMMLSLIPEEYYDRTSKMILGCTHLGNYKVL